MRALTLAAFLFLLAGNLSAAEIDLVKIPMSQTKLDFLTLYKKQWDFFGLPWKLNKVIDEAFTEQTENLMFGTVRLQLVMNTGNIQEKIQQAAEYKFNADYDKFLMELEDTWGEKLRSNVLDFYKRQSEAKFELTSNPMEQACLLTDRERLTENNGREAMSRISLSLSEKYGGTFLEGGAKMLTGRIIAVVYKQFMRKVGEAALKKISKHALGKVALGAVPVIGWAMTIWGAWDFYSMLSEAEDTIKAKMFESYNVMYSEEVPLEYWNAMEGYVRDVYIKAYENLNESISKGKSLWENPHVKELMQGLTLSDQRFLADRIAAISQNTEGKKYTLDDILARYGELMLDADREDFRNFAAMLAVSDTLPENYPPESVSRSTKPDSPSAKTFRIHEGH